MNKSDYKYTGKVIDCEKLTPEELLQETAHRIEDYERVCNELLKLKDDDLEANSPENNREFWSDEDEEEYNDLLDSIKNKELEKDEAWCRLREVMRIIYGDNTFWASSVGV